MAGWGTEWWRKGRPNRPSRSPWLGSTSAVERVSLLVGFVAALLATVATAAWVDPAATDVAAVRGDVAAARAHLRTIAAAQGVLHLAQSFDGLIYVVPTDWSADPVGSDVVLATMTRAMRGRHEAVRTFLAGVAAAGLIDYAAVRARYDALAEAEGPHPTLAAYSATSALPNDLDRAVARQAGALQGMVLDRQWHALPRARAERDGRSLAVAGLGALGAAIPFLLALRAAGGRAPRRGGEGHGPHLVRAADLMALALAEARRRMEEGRLPGEASGQVPGEEPPRGGAA